MAKKAILDSETCVDCDEILHGTETKGNKFWNRVQKNAVVKIITAICQPAMDSSLPVRCHKMMVGSPEPITRQIS